MTELEAIADILNQEKKKEPNTEELETLNLEVEGATEVRFITHILFLKASMACIDYFCLYSESSKGP